MDARIASLAAALVIIALIGLAIQLGGEEQATETQATQTPITGTTTSPATSGSKETGLPWTTTTVITESGTTTTTTLTRTGPTTSQSQEGEAQAPSEEVETTTTTTTTTTEAPGGGPGQPTIVPGEPGAPKMGAVKVKVDKTVKAGKGWVTVKTVALELDEREGMLTANISLALPDPCWNTRASMEVEGPSATITVVTDRNPNAVCIQVIKDTTITVRAPADTMPSKLKIVVVIGGEAKTITVDVNESYQPKQAP
ncbi:MAG: hypothetical protein GSR84_04770 [Desulfurococcales archaeon]|nr:hypothetical protein [Desulfurococcales archaeon]